uniref:Uncharacterized protein n=1 Tax=Sphaerodactylus townsendi TaxID=933632 RepID=A0ACB8EU53_9SAUR
MVQSFPSLQALHRAYLLCGQRPAVGPGQGAGEPSRAKATLGHKRARVVAGGEGRPFSFILPSRQDVQLSFLGFCSSQLLPPPPSSLQGGARIPPESAIITIPGHSQALANCRIAASLEERRRRWWTPGQRWLCGSTCRRAMKP